MKNKLNQPIEETTKWSPHQGICSVKECLWNGRRHPEESNQPIEEKCPGTCTQCGGAETMWHVSETCGIGKAWANFNKKIEAGEIPDITKCPMNPMEMSNQPIEEKWKEEFDKMRHAKGPFIVSSEAVKAFIENILEQERLRLNAEANAMIFEGLPDKAPDVKDQETLDDVTEYFKKVGSNHAVRHLLSIINK